MEREIGGKMRRKNNQNKIMQILAVLKGEHCPGKEGGRQHSSAKML